MDPLCCTVIDAVDPRRSVDLDVYAPPSTTAAQLHAALLAGAELHPGRELWVGAAPLAATAGPALRHGALLVAHPPGTASPIGSAALHLCVVGGPDAGARLPLRPGRHVVGRSAQCALTLADPELSRQHFALTLSPQGLHVDDLRSSNGTTVETEPVGASGRLLRPGERLTAGASTVVVRLLDPRTTATTAQEAGRVRLQRSGARLPALADVVLRRPVEPEARERAPVPWVAVLAPLLLCLPMAWAFHQPSYLLFGLLGPFVALANTAADRLGRRRGQRRAHQQWRAEDDAAARRVDSALHGELAIRRERHADPAVLADAAQAGGPQVWRRDQDDPDLLSVSLGQATVLSQVRVERDGLAGRPIALAQAPATLRLDDVGHLALAGEPEPVQAVARWLVSQLAVQATPAAVRVLVIGDGPWGWTRWLPHRSPCSWEQLGQEVQRRRDGDADAPAAAHPVRWVVVVSELARWSAEPALALVLQCGASVGVHLVGCAVDAAAVAAGFGGLVQLPARGAARLVRPTATRPGGLEADDLMPDGVSVGWAEGVARSLAPLCDAAATASGADTAEVVRLASLLALGPAPGPALADRWRRRPRSTAAVVGAGPHGPVAVDLVRDGPHALVAGTTGAGKSELLQTLVVSLAAANRPDELAFVLVDYKGGAAFRGCADLPHVSGVVTDLDDRLAARALASLQAELTRRERLLAGAGVADIAQYQSLVDQDDRPRLGRLVIVIDEFRLLAVDLPQFLDGLVRLAAVGRSLGVHLVLATQRPAGIVSADIRANVNLRICLRVRDRSDSHDVLDAPDAALLPPGRPGRALLRTGAGPLTILQVALAGGSGDLLPLDRLTVLAAGTVLAATSDGPDQLAVLVRAANEASALVGAQVPPSPWLLPLPDVVTTGELLARDGDPLAIGLVDLPDQGRQPVLRWDVRTASHLAVVGAARTGRTQALLTVVLAALAAEPACEVHALDPSAGPLGRALAAAPQVGTVVCGDQPRLVRRLVRALASRLAGAPVGGPPTPTLLVIDGWESLTRQLERLDHGQGVDDLLALVRDGEAAGLRLVVAGGRGVLVSRLSTLLSERLVLRCADPTDLLLAGAPSATPLTDQPPGRALHLPSATPVQLAWPGTAEQVQAELAARRGPDRAGRGPLLRLVPLPVRVQLDRLPRQDCLAAQRVWVGVGGDDARPLSVDVDGLVVVAGPPGSGRSTTLRSIAQQLHDAGTPVLALCSLNTALDDGPWPTSAEDRPGQLAAHSGAVLVVDDADLLGPACVESALAAGRPVVLSTTSTHLAAAWTGWPAALRRQRTGVLLLPGTPHDGEPFGLRAEPPDDHRPGRGQLVVRGRAIDVQVAVP